MHGSRERENSIINHSFMAMFDEDILEDEMSQAELKPTHLDMCGGGSGAPVYCGGHGLCGVSQVQVE